jgi:hypothetical protein
MLDGAADLLEYTSAWKDLQELARKRNVEEEHVWEQLGTLSLGGVQDLHHCRQRLLES